MKKVNELLTYGAMLGLLMVPYERFVRILIELKKSAK